MSKAAAIPLVTTIGLGSILVAAIGFRRPEVTPSESRKPVPTLPEGAYLSHDWYEPPLREARRTLIPAGQNPNAICTLPNCRNCQIHATWKQSL